ncbi:MAG: hypothetical protein E4G95_04720 [Bacteroidia bacterium]|nr:MAG: hypothetical protein E4G95_04720 [Bacteroidia bacterium]
MQAAFIGYETLYMRMEIPATENGNLGYIPLSPRTVTLDEVTVKGERVPMKILKDTVEYNAKAFKINSGDVVEDLLKKLPGIEIDRAGNIKALGEDVRNVLVDGKEFFGNDPKVATKNLPADAIDKVQLFNKKSDEEEFTGIDDGSRNQTINLVLDEDKKNGVFGDVIAGGGTESHYQASGKVYRFSEKNQVAALGMVNNINQYGFSVGDYLSFTGGIANISHGGGKVTMGGDFPINFGETVNGYASSGAVGFNFAHSKSKQQRYFISYIGNASKRELEQSITTRQYTESGNFIQDEEVSQVQKDASNGINFGIRNLFRKTNNIIINGNISLNNGQIPLTSSLSSYENEILVNGQARNSSDVSDRLSGNINGSYLKNINKGRSILKIFGNGLLSQAGSETIFENFTSFENPPSSDSVRQFQDNSIRSFNYGGGVAFTRKVFKTLYMDIVMEAGNSGQELVRKQGNSFPVETEIDSLSPDFNLDDRWIKPSLSLRRNNDKSTLLLKLSFATGNYSTELWNDTGVKEVYNFLLPSLNWEYEYKTGRRVMLRYSANSNIPSANQLMPVVNNFNSLSLYYGNRSLKPEIIHSVSANWYIFDQFSFTSLFTSARISYTGDKINYSRSVNDRLEEIVTLVNVKSDLSAGISADFSTPIKPLGIKTNLSIDESYSRGINIVNDLENEITNLNHRLSLTFDNRKKDKWDINTGVGAAITSATYSIQDNLDDLYFDISWFGEVRYTPGKKLNMYVSADITNYTARTYEIEQLIPLVGAGVTWSFLKNNRASILLTGFDLLNRNTGIKRVSEMNYLRESRSNIIGRYVMLSFKWNLNKLGGSKSGIQIDVKKR